MLFGPAFTVGITLFDILIADAADLFVGCYSLRQGEYRVITLFLPFYLAGMTDNGDICYCLIYYGFR